MNLRHQALVVAAFCLAALGFSDTAYGQNTTIIVSPSVVNFNVSTGSPISSQSVDVSTNGGAVVVVPSVTTGVTWLTINPAQAFQIGAVSTPLQIGVNASNLPAGQYQATIQLTPSGGGTAASILVNMNVTGGGSSQLTVSPSSLTFSAPVGGGSQTPQVLTVSSSSVTNFNVSVSTQSGGNWLSINQSTGNTQINNQVQVATNATGLAQGTYLGTVNVTSPVGNAQVNVTLNVGTSGTQLSVTPSTLTFNAQIGGAAPPSQSFTVNAPTPTNFTVIPNAGNGGSWLQIFPGSGTTNGNNSVTVSVNPAGLTAGTYNGTVTATSSAGNAVVNIVLNVSPNPTLNVNPAGPLNFFYQTGGSLPPTQVVNVTSTGTSLPFTITTNPIGGWLVVSPFQSTGTPAALSVSINPAGLTPGQYSGSITINSPGAANPTTTIQVNLLVSTNPLLTANPSSLTFNGSVGGNAPANQTLTVGSTGTPLNFTAGATVSSSQSWLSVSPTSGTTTSGQLTVSVAPGSLPAGDYSGTITITSPGAANSPITIPVTLSLSNTTQLNASPSSLFFVYQVGQSLPNQQTVQLTSTGQSLPLTIQSSTSSCGSAWLGATLFPSQTPGTIQVGVAPTGITPQTCSGTITVTAAGAGNSPLTIPVTLVVSNNPLLIVSPTSVSISMQQGQNPVPQVLSLTSTNPAVSIPFTAIASTNSGGQWLFVGGSGNTPQNLQLQFNTATLAPGTYDGAITVSSSGLPQPLIVPVRVTVTSLQNLVLSPTSLSFTVGQGGSNPAGQPISVTSSQGVLNFSTSTSVNFPAGGSWLTVTPSTGATPSTLTVGVNAQGLAQGTYTGTVTVVAPGAANTPQTIPVTLTVTSPVSVAIAPTTLTFNFTTGSGTNPPNQNITITTTGGQTTFTVENVSTLNGGNWLTATPTTGSTVNGTAQIAVSVNPAPGGTPLAAGTYTGSIRINSPSLAQPVTVNVSFVVQTVLLPAPTTLVNAASRQPGSIAPGEIIEIKGTNIGPPNPQSYRVNSAGGLDPVLGGVRVLFDGFPGTPFYVSSTQVNVIAPYEFAGRTQVTVEVEYNGNRGRFTSPFAVTPTAPGLFTPTSTGSGQGSIVNAEDGTYNGPITGVAGLPTRPARRGQYVLIYITGGGQTNPPSATGQVSQGARQLVAPITVNIGGITVVPDYAGSAPLYVAGLEQINVRVPDNAPIGDQIPVTVTIGGVTSPATVTMAIRAQ